MRYNKLLHYRKAQKHLAHQQRRLARKQKGSYNHLKQQNKIAKLHQKIARQLSLSQYNITIKLLNRGKLASQTV